MNKLFESIDLENALNRVRDKRKIERGQERRVRKFFNSLSKKELDIWIPKFLKWEEKYEEFYYKKYIEQDSRLFNIVIDIIEKRAEYLGMTADLKEDFLSSAFRWNGYTFKHYVGQGCFWRIMKDGKQIFQSR